MPHGVLDMLWRVGARPGDRFYDLGSGSGKVVATAWMAGLHATGVELSHARWDVSREAVLALSKMDQAGDMPQGGKTSPLGIPARVRSGLDFVWGSCFDLDFTDADVIFVSSVMFSQLMLDELATIARWMKPGSRIISFKLLPGPEFEKIGEFCQPTSWSLETPWWVQEVVFNPPVTQARPEKLRWSVQFDASQRCSFMESFLSSSPNLVKAA
jgi:SAM-dependent methyltransferase